MRSGSRPIDEIVTLNSNYAWTFDPNNRAASGFNDAIGALEHEISEGGMGRTQGLGMTGLVNINGQQEQNWFGHYMPLDLFRYTSSHTRDLTNPWQDIATPGGGFFSIDGSNNLLAVVRD